MIRVLYAAPRDRFETFAPIQQAAFQKAGLSVDLGNRFPPEDVDYIIYAPNGGLTDFRPFTRAKAVLSLWAGVETIVGNRTLTQPLCKMSERGLTEGMVEWVAGHVLRHHLGMDAQRAAQFRGAWVEETPPLARDRRVGILGLGQLGGACAAALATLNFQVAGWSRGSKIIGGVETFTGHEGLRRVLRSSEILVLLLPQTPETENLIDAQALAQMPDGAVILNPGRGSLIDDDALLAALESGKVAHATLDVFRTEPLPQGHPFWTDPGITITPHVASATRPETAAASIAENVRRGEAGEPFLSLVDRGRAY